MSRTHPSLTQCTLLTGAGRSAVAVILIDGSGAASAIERCFQPNHQRPLESHQIRFGQWHGVDESIPPESVVVSPISPTSFEVHCHGGPAAIERIVGDLRQIGVPHRERGASGEGTGDPDKPLAISEAEQVLQRCETQRMAAHALDQVRGALVDWAQGLINDVTHGASTLSTAVAAVRQRLADSEFGLHLATPYQIVLAGPPNVGKSSLINAIVGYQRSITLDEAGTTRDVLHVDTVISGVPVQLSDTAGIRSDGHLIEQQGIERAQLAIRAADLVIWVSQPGLDPSQNTAGKRSIRVLNKADLPIVSAEPYDLQTIAIAGQGIEALMDLMVERLVGSVPAAGSPLAVTPRQVECLRAAADSSDTERFVTGLQEAIWGPGSRVESGQDGQE